MGEANRIKRGEKPEAKALASPRRDRQVKHPVVKK